MLQSLIQKLKPKVRLVTLIYLESVRISSQVSIHIPGKGVVRTFAIADESGLNKSSTRFGNNVLMADEREISNLDMSR
jgi:hypothetical protein